MAADLFTVQTLPFKTLYVLLCIAHGRRELVHWHVTTCPAAAWVWRQVTEVTSWGRKLNYLLRDRDASNGGEFSRRAKRLGAKTLLTPIRAQRANTIAERDVGTCRRECLDHLIVGNDQRLRSVLWEFVAYYNADRPHPSLDLETPVPPARRAAGPVCSLTVLGGLHHVYGRVP